LTLIDTLLNLAMPLTAVMLVTLPCPKAACWPGLTTTSVKITGTLTGLPKRSSTCTANGARN
jgi:hypothetical protein